MATPKTRATTNATPPNDGGGPLTDGELPGGELTGRALKDGGGPPAPSRGSSLPLTVTATPHRTQRSSRGHRPGRTGLAPAYPSGSAPLRVGEVGGR